MPAVKGGLWVLFFILVSSCSSNLKYPIKAKKYKSDLVSVETSLNIAVQSYVKACLKYSEKGSLNKCITEARKFVKEDIVYILDQN